MEKYLIFMDITIESIWSDITLISLKFPKEKLIINNISNEVLSIKVSSNITKVNHQNCDNFLCNWCRLELLDKDNSVGIPERIKYNNNKVEYYTYGTFCSYNCALAYQKQEKDCTYYKKSLLKILFRDLYPNKILIPSPDWRLLKNNGGTLSIEEFFDIRYLYKYSNNHNIISIDRNITSHKIGSYRNY